MTLPVSRPHFTLLSAAIFAFASLTSLPVMAQDIDFGDDSSGFARDGECDDPRFEGEGMAAAPVEADILNDASDCRKAYQAGLIAYIGGADAPVTDEPVVADVAVDFGADTSSWANNGECDDPRFAGTGMASVLLPEDTLADATDCRTLFEAGSITLAAGGDTPVTEPTDGAVDFGTDTSDWANNGECDDPRFAGTGMASVLLPEDTLADATDCRALFEAGSITLAAGGDTPVTEPTDGAVDFGADTSSWANNGECDDPRFAGTGMASVLLPEDTLADATDCRTLFEAGSITLAAGGDQPTTQPTNGSVDFGTDTSDWANNGECDDPRFAGTGMASVLLPEDTLADATDCRTLFEAGSITLAAGGDQPTTQPTNGAVDFGADTSDWANNGECDDPRFAGTGMASVLLPEDTLADATDCRTLFEAGSITLAAGGDQPTTQPTDGAVDFGADSGQWTLDGECDDPRFVGDGMADVLVDADLFADATDCRTLFESGSITLRN